mgnify:CR=1 FL=1
MDKIWYFQKFSDSSDNLNDFCPCHNQGLKSRVPELSQIRESYLEAFIVCANYFNALMQLYRFPQQFGSTSFHPRCRSFVLFSSSRWCYLHFYCIICIFIILFSVERDHIFLTLISCPCSWSNFIRFNHLIRVEKEIRIEIIYSFIQMKNRQWECK